MNISFPELTSPKTVKGISIGIGIMVVGLLIFQAGKFVGYRKAAFSYGLGDNYYRAFNPQRDDKFVIGFSREDLPGAHGAVGKIIQVDLPTFIVLGPDNIERIVNVNGATSIRKFRSHGSTTDLRVNEHVIVLGSPDNSGQISAKLIRLVPPPEIASTTLIMATGTEVIFIQKAVENK